MTNETRVWLIGQTSDWLETHGRSAATISSGDGDLSGVSYGACQLSLPMGNSKKSRMCPR